MKTNNKTESHSTQKETFEKLLTYRKRMSRMCTVQAAYLFNILSIVETSSKETLFSSKEEIENKADNLIMQIMYFYNNPFVVDQNSPFGTVDENKKIDMKHCQGVIGIMIESLDEIDQLINKYLNEKWRVENLDLIIKAILRVAIAESMKNSKPDTSIITSEYTNLASKFLFSKQIGFVNGVLDKAIKDIRSNS